ncbi:deoxyhypusine synthase [Vittaforma corneae ATCC 50505]|uniref:deoxyhypusine synthase n=1 Tax=Vittaforma corneae (strain ATCC 50505) TaxID=993615 RepID=L2GMM6_VITCO|nr:deoxyhypusine synthase [Vittaforma corneae ATCC 50505]ELA41889.1 deoxyhypusine synthase [Vittaforma corneae ATCC 50505]
MEDKKTCVADLASQKDDKLKFEEKVVGLDFEQNITIDDILMSFATTGFQATNVHKAIQEIKRMRQANARIYLGCTSNMMSCGVREIIKFLAKSKYFEVMVVTGGGVEEDLIKCMLPTYVGSFDLDGQTLRDNGWNRIGNLVISNDNYAAFESWFNKTMDELISGETEEYPNSKISHRGTKEYTEENPLILTPSKFVRYLGKKINNEDSVLYWCYRNNINVYSPAITDGSLGDLLTFYNRKQAFKLDIVEDITGINFECLGHRENGAIILGGGLVKHHILNGNLFNDGLDYCVIVNTAVEYDGSDTGASLGEAYSWGKVKSGRTALKVYGDASVIFPLIVYGAFKSKRL